MAQSRPAMDVAQDIIRPTEDVKVAIDARFAPRTDVDSENWSVNDDEPSVPRRKILAVIVHVHSDGRHEQGW